jgi:hypothetical protein
MQVTRRRARDQKISWLTTGTFSQRLFKEALVIFPCTFLLGYYYFFVRIDAIEFTLTKLIAIAALLTLAISAFNARKPAPQPPAKDSDSVVVSSRD